MARCDKCGKFCKKAKEGVDLCTTCRHREKTRQMYKGVYADIPKPKPRKPQQVIMTDDEQKKVDDYVRMRFGLPVQDGRIIPPDSEEFKRIAEELIEREKKKGRSFSVAESKISRLAL